MKKIKITNFKNKECIVDGITNSSYITVVFEDLNGIPVDEEDDIDDYKILGKVFNIESINSTNPKWDELKVLHKGMGLKGHIYLIK